MLAPWNSLILSDNARITISIPFMIMDFQFVANLAAVSGPQSLKFAADEPRLAHKSFNTTGRNKLLRDEIYGKIKTLGRRMKIEVRNSFISG